MLKVVNNILTIAKGGELLGDSHFSKVSIDGVLVSKLIISVEYSAV